MHPKETYEPLLSRDGESVNLELTSGGVSVRERRQIRRRDLLLVVETVLLFVVSVLWLRSTRSISIAKEACQVLYSPAQEAIVYEVKQFGNGIWDTTIYEDEPSEEVDQAWNDLYNDFGISQIPEWQADRLPNPSAPFPENPEYYIVQLSAFHQMHCLNNIRKALWSEHYVDPVTGELDGLNSHQLRAHLNHCLDTLRQGIMCAGDVSPIVWHWSDEDQGDIINLDIAHSCRSYDSLVTWAKEHKSQYHFNQTVHRKTKPVL
ncbi:hypothetical protein NM688_g3948 [Phlebia brevispora]|uniref:Uncharacterized protein n=1 Tax=Phlebia brevispora TaxID=194682 RepID=A0ACC1T4G3_9APHY|nr:hypothetical protein NM688_g3948 [Phlebia brevispora]